MTISPDRAAELLEHNTLNRPLSESHVHRIAGQIISGKWCLNGDSIKVAKGGDVLDGQHRLWAIVESKKSVETVLVTGIEREAFSTIDTIRRSRSGGDTLALNGVERNRNQTATALQWLLRWQRKVIEDWRSPTNRIENSDVEAAFEKHPKMVHAVERASACRRLGNVGILAFLYYIFASRDHDLAERMLNTLENPAGVGVNDPFYRLRAYFTSDHHENKDALYTIAMAIKAANAATQGRTVQVLAWKNQGKAAEPFPKLEIV